ncbi:uncharacterized protein PV06_04300 [Exophiala oligosperma]|uniref:AAA+ ATPase domain-containing protein n=1 Tax=Exophiala oligosperma TaxID=215243 RepID=A0A0D2DL70_9EURO|nr:uncharacterized protein PV06_04300 [Exophiala oligosperma]KIW43165.1 hypothetical protein PV06_04300 [Exophiala oligosperma]
MSVNDYKKARGALSSKLDEEADISKIELVDIIETEGRWGSRSTITLTADIHKARQDKERFQEYALILRRLRDEDGKPLATRLEIQSPIIRAAIQEVLGEYPTVNMESNPIIIERPYAPLYHYRKELREYAMHTDRTREEKDHMSTLIHFMDLYLRKAEKTNEKLLPSELTSHNLLWTLYRPDDVVIARRDYFTEAYVIESCSVVEYPQDNEMKMHITLVCRSWDYNGARFGPVSKTINLRGFIGNKKIYDLDVYPVQYHREPDGQDIRRKLINRGLKWRNIVEVAHREYDAICWTDPLTQAEEVRQIEDLVPVHTSGRIILDYATHQQARPQLATLLARGSATKAVTKDAKDAIPVNQGDDFLLKVDDNSKSSKRARSEYDDRYLSHPNDATYKITHSQALICPARIRGFSLTDKIWAFFLVDEVKDITWAEDSFTTLELEPSVKKTISALVHSHGKSNKVRDQQADDVISGKGKGLVFLLTGPPGLGKTLTAESIAENTHRPLYALTCGELGTDPVETDQILRRIFIRAKSWNAILLLDEADVFLAKRERNDLQRNAFVSIFLRLIEYYAGILFLTTNRLTEFDEAFQSRIHLTVHFKLLDDVMRAAIWKNLLSRFDPGGLPGRWHAQILARLGREYRINGREIKNLIRTAAALAEFEGVALDETHFKTVYTLNTTQYRDGLEVSTTADQEKTSDRGQG